MSTPTIDALAHRAARFSRRRSLLTLGGAAVAAATATVVEPVSARKKNNKKNKSKNNKGRGNGADCKQRERQRCTNDATACKATVRSLCSDLDNPACLAVQTCCDSCSASSLLTCITAINQS